MPNPYTPSRKDIKKLEAINTLIQQHQYDDAYNELVSLTKKKPRLIDAWDMLLELAGQLENIFVVWKACETLHELDPDEYTYVYNLVVTSAQLNFPFLTKYYSDIYLRDFPNTLKTEEIAKINASVSEELPQIRADSGIPDTATLDDLYYHEKAQILITHGDIVEGRKLAKQAIRKLPEIAAPRNNLALSYTITGEFEKALKIVEETLATFPDNLFALCSQTQYLIRLGRHDDAEPLLNIIHNKKTDNPDYWLKMVETLAFTNDDKAVKHKYDEAVKNIKDRDFIIPPLLYHFGAVAYARSGDSKVAKKLWKKAQSSSYDLDLVRDNLFDLERKPSQQVGAWYFNLSQLLVKSWIERLARAGELSQKKGERAYEKDIERIFRANPALKETMPLLLTIGDSICIDFVLSLASVYPVPELAEFVLGTHGTDEQRMKAGNIAVEQGFLKPNTPTRMSIDGEYREMMLWNIEIYEEPTAWDGDEKVQELYETAYYQMLEGDYEDALVTIKDALSIAPDKRELLNIQINALTALNRDDEADALIHEIVKKHPDYFFARIDMARLLIRHKKFDEVEQWLAPLREKQRFHVSEFKSLAVTQVEYLLAIDERDSAISWIQIWNSIDPDSVPLNYKIMSGISNMFKK